jgi:hypothetical protein
MPKSLPQFKEAAATFTLKLLQDIKIRIHLAQ